MDKSLNLLTLTLNPNRNEITNITNNKNCAIQEYRENFIKVCFCQEDLYEKFIVAKGKHPNKKSKYDYIYKNNEYLLLMICKLLKAYKRTINKYNQNPFPVDRYEFQILFFNFLCNNNTYLKYLKILVMDKQYLSTFISKLKLMFKNINNVYFHDENTKTKIIEILDNLMLDVENIN